MEIRLKAIAAAACGAVALLLRLFPPDVYHFYPACPWRALTGWRCPGCGMTHALAALVNGRFAEAIEHNPLVMVLPPLVAVFIWQYRGGTPPSEASSKCGR